VQKTSSFAVNILIVDIRVTCGSKLDTGVSSGIAFWAILGFISLINTRVCGSKLDNTQRCYCVPDSEEGKRERERGRGRWRNGQCGWKRERG
jgi:hypothetical protein